MLSQSKRKVALFAAISLFCAMVEMVIPKPGFIRIGLSNIPIMLALYCSFSLSEYSLLVLVRLVLQAVLNGTLVSYAFILSASAGLSSATVMYLAYKFFEKKSKAVHISFVTIGEAGAFVSNLVQIYVSHFFLGDGVYALTSLILGCGMVTSFVLGLFTSKFCEKSEFMRTIRDVTFFAAFIPDYKVMTSRIKFDRVLKIVISAVALVICLFADSLVVSGGICLMFLCACIVAKRHLRFWPVVWTIFRTVLISVLVPSGKIIFSTGILTVTQDSVILGLDRSFAILSSCWFSRFIIPTRDEIDGALKPDSVAYMTFAHFKEITEQWYKIDEKMSVAKKVDKTLVNSVKNCSNF